VNYFLIIGLTFNLIYLASYRTRSKSFQTEDFITITLLTIATFEILNAFLFTSELIRTYPHFLRFNTPFVFILAPAIWLFVRNRLHKSSIKWSDLLHLVPFTICIIYLLPLYFSTPYEKVQYMDRLIQGTSEDSYVLGGLRRVQQTIYVIVIGWSCYKLIKNISIHQQRFTLSVYSIFCLIWVIGLFRYLFWFNLSGGLIEVSLLCLLSVLLVYVKLSNDGKGWKTNTETIKYKTSGLSPEIRAKYVRQIKETLIEKKLFTNPDLTLSSFAEQVSIPSHHLSQVFSQEMNTNFKELVNAQRVEEAKSLLLREQSKRFKIETIAFQSGFKSISGFNTSFKKLTGARPKDYRLSISVKDNR
jgi:AraC-like DNA-binding protein